MLFILIAFLDIALRLIYTNLHKMTNLCLLLKNIQMLISSTFFNIPSKNKIFFFSRTKPSFFNNEKGIFGPILSPKKVVFYR